MKTITLWQPWASLMADGRKLIETRSWGTNHRGPLGIHAAVRHLGCDFARDCGYDVDSLPRGVVIAVVNLTSCHRMTPGWIASISATERKLGLYEPGRWAWHCSIIEVLAKPIPARGRQMLWECDLKKLGLAYSLFTEDTHDGR